MLFLHYAACSTCKKARAWLRDNSIGITERGIVDDPPTKAELEKWIPASGLPVRKWINTSGQSYRAMGKAKVDAMTDAQIVDALSKDGKLVKRPVLVAGGKVLVGFDAARYGATFL